MAYELRHAGRATTFATEPEAIAAARAALQADPDADVELIDLTTGQPAAPGSSASWREHLRNNVGF